MSDEYFHVRRIQIFPCPQSCMLTVTVMVHLLEMISSFQYFTYFSPGIVICFLSQYCKHSVIKHVIEKIFWFPWVGTHIYTLCVCEGAMIWDNIWFYFLPTVLDIGIDKFIPRVIGNWCQLINLRCGLCFDLIILMSIFIIRCYMITQKMIIWWKFCFVWRWV